MAQRWQHGSSSSAAQPALASNDGAAAVADATMSKTKTAQRILAAATHANESTSPREQAGMFCEMVSLIREAPDALEKAEADPVGYLGEYINLMARSGEAIDVYAVVQKLRNVHLHPASGGARAMTEADLATIHAFYAGMIKHANGLKRLSADLPAEDAMPEDPIGSFPLDKRIAEFESKLRYLVELEEETRTRVSASAADKLHSYVELTDARIKLLKSMNKKK